MSEYVNQKDLRDALYDADVITMEGVKIINQFPSADVAPVRHGHWIYHPDDLFPYESTQECSYCPNCGAKMDEVTGITMQSARIVPTANTERKKSRLGCQEKRQKC